MNTALTNAIIEHIYSNLGLLDERTSSLTASKFATSHTIKLEEEGGEESENKVYACQSTYNNTKIIMGATSISDINGEEIIVVIKIEGCPTYACTLIQNGRGEIQSSDICFSLQKDQWISADTFIQASFLAGMEQFRDITASFIECENSKEIYQLIVSFIKYLDKLNEG